MERVGQIALREEVFLNDAFEMADWLDNEAVTKYLSEGSETARAIRQKFLYKSSPIVTHIFNMGGKFYIIDLNGKAIGYSKLVPKENGCEIVVVIGNEKMWNKGYGRKVLDKVMQEAFFTYRYETVTAKIMNGNDHSLHLFEKFGFTYEKTLNTCLLLKMNVEDYLKKAA